MDLSRAVYSRDLKIAAMRALDAGSTIGEIARKYQLSPKLLERWRGEWRAKGESVFPGIGRRGLDPPALRIDAQEFYEWLIAELATALEDPANRANEN
jgi:transposase-like protein